MIGLSLQYSDFVIHQCKPPSANEPTKRNEKNSRDYFFLRTMLLRLVFCCLMLFAAAADHRGASPLEVPEPLVLLAQIPDVMNRLSQVK
jgi:hypothetical protein